MNLMDRLRKVTGKLSPPEAPANQIIVYNRYKNETKEQAIKSYEKENGIKVSSNDNTIFIALKDDKFVKPVDIDELTDEELLEYYKSIASDEELKLLNDEFENDEPKDD
jgi:hypothetical protein